MSWRGEGYPSSLRGLTHKWHLFWFVTGQDNQYLTLLQEQKLCYNETNEKSKHDIVNTIISVSADMTNGVDSSDTCEIISD